MGIFRFSLLSIMLLLNFSLLAAPAAAKVEKLEKTDRAVAPAPVLSNAGKKRLKENIDILQANITDLEETVSTAEKNLATIESEITDLEGLEKEHLELRKKYSGYLDDAKREMEKNEKAKKELEKWERSQSGAEAQKEGAAGLKEKFEAARAEKKKREKWREDAAAKVARVTQLVFTLNRNLREIGSRRGPLLDQVASWKKRDEQYKSALEGMKKKWHEMTGGAELPASGASSSASVGPLK